MRFSFFFHLLAQPTSAQLLSPHFVGSPRVGDVLRDVIAEHADPLLGHNVVHLAHMPRHYQSLSRSPGERNAAAATTTPATSAIAPSSDIP